MAVVVLPIAQAICVLACFATLYWGVTTVAGKKDYLLLVLLATPLALAWFLALFIVIQRVKRD